ncbi:MAG: autotransporter-associated beta strand repeat-containing protein, partial [Kiritimatiellaeota bacterium]|nr:autotransporter-associated beta strand repeat-containing protein [Kiritimatiellota bacterium]
HSSNRAISLDGTTGGATLEASGSGALNLSSTAAIVSGAGSKTLTLTGTSTGANTLAGIVQDNSVANKTALTKDGVGKWILSGANTYTGKTTVSGGTLALSGGGKVSSVIDIATGGKIDVTTATASTYTLGSGAVMTNNGTFAGGLIVGSGAQVSGGGSYGPVTNQSGGFLTPGAGGHTNYYDSLTLNGGSTNSCFIGPTYATHDMSVVTNGLSGNGASPLLRLGLSTYVYNAADLNKVIVLYDNLGASANAFDGSVASKSFTISDFLSNGSASSFDNLPLLNNTTFSAVGGGSATNMFRINYDAVANGDAVHNDITLTVIPEPTTLQLLMFLGTAFSLRRKLRQGTRGITRKIVV